MGLQPSRLPPPSVLRRAEQQLQAPVNAALQHVTLRPTGQQLNAAGDFYSPVRPRDALKSSASEFRQHLAISRIKTPTPTPTPRHPLRYDQMKTPDRWRTTAMHSNQEELNESALRRWEEEDALQADRLLEQAAREGDHEALWDDLFYGTKAARAKTSQQLDQPVVYSTSNFPEVLSSSRSTSRDDSCYETEDRFPKSPYPSDYRGMLPSELSTMSISDQTKPSTVLQSDFGSHVVDSDATSPPTSTQTISEMLASMDKAFETQPLAGDLVARGDRNYDGSSGGGDKEQNSNCEAFAGELLMQSALSNAELPRWSVILVAACVLVGSCGFLMEELMSFTGLFSKNAPLSLSRAEQDRMRDRVIALQHELQGFQHSTSEIEVKSQTVLTQLQRHMNKMRLDRERHQDILAGEMQELRRYMLDITHELVEKERESIQTKLKELVKIQVINEVETNDHNTIAPSEDDSNDTVKEIVVEASSIIEAGTETHESVNVRTPGSSIEHVNDEQAIEKQCDVEHNEESTTMLTPHEGKETESSGLLGREQLGATQSDAILKAKQVVTPSILVVKDPKDGIEVVPEVHVDEIYIETTREAVAAHHEGVVKSTTNMTTTPKPARTGMSWDRFLLLVGIMFLVACVVLRVYNIHRRKRWFAERRRRRNQRALLLAQQRARAMADNQDDSDEWDTDCGVEEVSLMTPVRDSEDDEAKSEVHQSPEIDTDFEDDNQREEASNSHESYQAARTEVSDRCL
ncbi:unnamed protein product [Phytophthora fragariaefolia]|uniref:Unnamed protein product n=1 Tax=Phytophthora fragariaefolia TaxID=1490495 RepID=A0A9W6XN64_9STRA|nr:unnamed protein product [Phytophthora fragariaefolia]